MPHVGSKSPYAPLPFLLRDRHRIRRRVTVTRCSTAARQLHRIPPVHGGRIFVDGCMAWQQARGSISSLDSHTRTMYYHYCCCPPLTTHCSDAVSLRLFPAAGALLDGVTRTCHLYLLLMELLARGIPNLSVYYILCRHCVPHLQQPHHVPMLGQPACPPCISGPSVPDGRAPT